MKKILITAGRAFMALEIARKFHEQGHLVYAVDNMHFPFCRFSNAVQKNFVVPSPRETPRAFIQALVAIVEREQIDMIIPIYEESIYLSEARNEFPSTCELFTPEFSLAVALHNKWSFNQILEKLGISRPQTYLIEKIEDLNVVKGSGYYALKPCYSRASLHLKKWSSRSPIPKLDVSPSKPWVAQRWIEGNQYCTYSIVRKGKLLAHAVYPVGFTADGKGCIAFKAIDHPAILDWVAHFVREINYTGQIAFDIIEQEGELYAIECNPRATSGAFLFADERLDKAFLGELDAPVISQAGAERQIFFAMLLYGWKRSSVQNNQSFSFVKELFRVRDVIFSQDDWIPALAQPLTLSEIWTKSLHTRMSLPATYMFDFEWNGQEGASANRVACENLSYNVVVANENTAF